MDWVAVAFGHCFFNTTPKGWELGSGGSVYPSVLDWVALALGYFFFILIPRDSDPVFTWSVSSLVVV